MHCAAAAPRADQTRRRSRSSDDVEDWASPPPFSYLRDLCSPRLDTSHPVIYIILGSHSSVLTTHILSVRARQLPSRLVTSLVQPSGFKFRPQTSNGGIYYVCDALVKPERRHQLSRQASQFLSVQRGSLGGHMARRAARETGSGEAGWIVCRAQAC